MPDAGDYSRALVPALEGKARQSSRLRNERHRWPAIPQRTPREAKKPLGWAALVAGAGELCRSRRAEMQHEQAVEEFRSDPPTFAKRPQAQAPQEFRRTIDAALSRGSPAELVTAPDAADRT